MAFSSHGRGESQLARPPQGLGGGGGRDGVGGVAVVVVVVVRLDGRWAVEGLVPRRGDGWGRDVLNRTVKDALRTLDERREVIVGGRALPRRDGSRRRAFPAGVPPMVSLVPLPRWALQGPGINGRTVRRANVGGGAGTGVVAETADAKTTIAETADAEKANAEKADAEKADAETAVAETADVETANAETAIAEETADAETADAETAIAKEAADAEMATA